MRLFCLGLGGVVESHLALFKSIALEGIAACARNQEKCRRLQSIGIDAHLWDVSTGLDDRGIQALMTADLVIVSAPPNAHDLKSPDPFFRQVAETLSARTSGALVYLSSTNVYGNCDGAWVDETAQLNPSSARGEARALAETLWQSLPLQVHVFRLAGIYGMKRNQIRKLQSGKARQLIKSGHVFNRIHESDIAKAIVRAAINPKAGVYNLADGQPAPPQEVLAFASHLCAVPLPPPELYADAVLKGLAAEFYKDNKRISHQALKEWLAEPLVYPSYQQGLTAIWKQMQSLPID